MNQLKNLAPTPTEAIYFPELKQITEKLLAHDEPDTLRQSAVRLYSLFSDITRINLDSVNRVSSYHISLPTGKALCMRDAARCIIDYARTSRFLRGIYAALHEALNRFACRPIEILYAGCGPFATLAVPLTTQFTAQQIQFTLLDVNRASIESARLTFQELGLADYVRGYVQADASSYVHYPCGSLHIIIVEAMQRALEKEPQVSVTANLALQLCQGGILIPEKITVDACLRDMCQEFTILPTGSEESTTSFESTRVRINLARVFELTAESSNALLTACQKDALMEESCSPVITIGIPTGVEENLELVLSTTVTVFGSVVLGEYDSSITMPVTLGNINEFGGKRQVDLQYHFGSVPGFRHKWVS